MDKLLSELEKKANMPDDTSNPYEELAYPKSTINTNYLGPDGNPMMEMETPTGEMQAPMSVFEKPFNAHTNSELPEDWTLVESQQVQGNLNKFTVTEYNKGRFNQLEKVKDTFNFFTPVTLTQEMLKDVKKEDKEASKKTADDLHAMTYGQLADWAVSHAKVEGANPLYVRLAESMATVKKMTDERGQVPAAATCEYRKQFNNELDHLQNLANEYYDSHNSFFKFSSKGRIRLELASMLKDTSKNSTISKLKKDDELFFRNALLDNLLAKQTVRSDSEIERYKMTFKLNDGETVTYKEAENILGKGAEINRRPLLALYKDSALATGEEKQEYEAWNTRTTEAIGELLLNKNDKFKEIMTDTLQEIMDLHFDTRFLDPDYLLGHADEYFKLNNLMKRAEIINGSHFADGPASAALEEIKNSNPAYFKIARERYINMYNAYDHIQNILAQYYTIKPTRLEEYGFFTSQQKEASRNNLLHFERAMFEDDYKIFYDRQAECTLLAEKENFIQEFSKYAAAEHDTYDELVKTEEYGPTIKAAEEWRKKGMIGSKGRPGFNFMFKDIVYTSGDVKTANEAYNKRSLQALKDMLNGDFTGITSIFREFADTILNITFPRDILDPHRVLTHPEELVKMRNLNEITGVIYNRGDYPPEFRNIIDNILAENPQGKELFDKMQEIFTQYNSAVDYLTEIEYSLSLADIRTYHIESRKSNDASYKYWTKIHKGDVAVEERDHNDYKTYKDTFMKLAEPYFEK